MLLNQKDNADTRMILFVVHAACAPVYICPGRTTQFEFKRESTKIQGVGVAAHRVFEQQKLVEHLLHVCVRQSIERQEPINLQSHTSVTSPRGIFQEPQHSSDSFIGSTASGNAIVR